MENQGITFVWELLDKVTAPLQNISKLEEQLRDNLHLGQSNLKTAQNERNSLYKKEGQDLRTLKDERQRATDPKHIEKLNTKIQQSTRNMSLLKQETTGLSAVMNKLSSPFNKLFGGITGQILGAASAYVGFQGIVASTKAYDTQMKAEAQLRASLESTQSIASKTFEELTATASRFQGLTLFGDEVIIQAQSQLLTFTNIWDETFDQATIAAMDMSTKLGTDLNSSILQVGKALNDPLKGITALSRAGVQFTKEQEENIKSLVGLGKTQEAQQIILNELQNQFGGSAEAAAKSGTGAWTQLMNTIGDIQEVFGGLIMDVGGEFLPLFQDAAALFGKFADYAKSNSSQIAKLVKIFAIFGASITSLIAIWKVYTTIQMIANAAMFANPVGLIVAGIVGLIAAISASIVYWEEITDWVKKFGHWLLVLAGPIGMIASLLIEHWGEVKGFFIKIGNEILDFIDDIIPGFKDSFNKFGNWLFGWISETWQKITGWWDGLMDYLGFDGGKVVVDTPDIDRPDPTRTPQEQQRLESLRAAKTRQQGVSFSDALSGVSDVGGKRDVRNNNIRIDSLIKNISISPASLEEGVNDIKEKITRALVDAVRDTEIALN